MRFLAGDIYAFLEAAGCEYHGDRYPAGQAWIAPGEQVFFLPDPDPDASGNLWFDAEVLIDNFRDRWLGSTIPGSIRRYD